VPQRQEITIEDSDADLIEVRMHDGSVIMLKKATHDPRDKQAAMRLLQESKISKQFITGLIYIADPRPTLPDLAKVPSTPLAHLTEAELRPSREALHKLMADLI
jgi:2-oxoglutarate ferredoxin oxidoreductase subunit beta